MKEKIFRQQGTALLVTVLLAGAISAIAFGMTKVTLNEVFVGMKDQEGLEAHYAAQAGVEDALLRYKFHDQTSLEMPDGARGGANGTNEVVRIYLNQPSVAKVDPTVVRPAANADDYYYDLKVWHKMDCSVDLCEYKLKKDESVLLDTSSAGATINVSWNLHGADGSLITNLTHEQAKQTGLWYRLSDPTEQNRIDPTPQGRDFFTVFSYFNSSDNDNIDPRFASFALLRSQTNFLSVRTAKSLKFKAFMANSLNDGSYIKVTITSGIIGGPKTYIESTGHYGDTAKKIEVTVDRESKSIIDVFDYVIYSGVGPLPR
jgi:hypothetical protein